MLINESMSKWSGSSQMAFPLSCDKETLWREAQQGEILVTFSVLKVTRFS